MVEHLHPTNLEEALIAKMHHPELKPYAGGTDWMVVRKPEQPLLFIGGIKKLQEISVKENEVYIGSGSIYTDLIHEEVLPSVLREAMSNIASPAIRNIATIGGNICNASPAGDTLPALYALGATVQLSHYEKGEVVHRLVPIESFILGIRSTALMPNELLTAIIIPRETYDVNYYEKVGARKSEAISKLSFVGLASIKADKVTALRIAFGSVGLTVIRSRDLEAKGEGLSLEAFKHKAKDLYRDYDEIIHPITDQRSTAHYRKTVCMNLLSDFFERIEKGGGV